MDDFYVSMIANIIIFNILYMATYPIKNLKINKTHKFKGD